MKIKVSVLASSIYYYLERVFIFSYRGKFRLVVYHQGKILIDDLYKSPKGARIAFLKLYWYRIDDLAEKALRTQRRQRSVFWTHFVEPESQWFNQLKGLNLEKGWN